MSYTGFRCLKLLITGMLSNVVFLGHIASIKKGLKEKHNLRKIIKISKTTYQLSIKTISGIFLAIL